MTVLYNLEPLTQLLHGVSVKPGEGHDFPGEQIENVAGRWSLTNPRKPSRASPVPGRAAGNRSSNTSPAQGKE